MKNSSDRKNIKCFKRSAMECQKNLDCANIVNLRRVSLCRKLKCKTFDTVLYCFHVLCASLLLFVPSLPSVSCDLDWPSQLTYDSIFNHTTYVQIEHNKYNPENKYQQNTQNNNYDLPSDYESNESPNNYIDDDKLDYSFTNTGPNDFVEDYRVDTSPKNKGNGESWLVGFSHDPYRLSVSDKDYEKGVSYKTAPPMKDVRGKRGVMHLYNMIWCATGCEPLMYKGYGCYCGFLGSGRPTDGIDRCCKMHDECYENIYCPFFTVYFQPYYWKCHRGEPLCALENRKTSHQYINGCAARLCECDRKLAMCLRQYNCPRRRSFCRSSPLRFLQNILTLHVA